MVKTILISVLLLLTAGICYGARFEYTWKNEAGELFITDYEPPPDAEILDVSVIPMPEEEQVAPVIAPTDQELNETRKQLMAEAAELREEERSLRLKAAYLLEEAMEQRRLAKKHHYKQRYRRRAGYKEEDARELLKQADGLAQQASELERRASQLK